MLFFFVLATEKVKSFSRKIILPIKRKLLTSVRISDWANQLTEESFVYGLPELNREEIKKASECREPRMFCHRIQLGVLPLAKAGLLTEVHSTGITGSTGAGQKLQDTTHFTWRANNISAYKTLTHQHLKEISRSIKQLQPGYSSAFNFVPWRGDFTRGIFVSSVIHNELSLDRSNGTLFDILQRPSFTLRYRRKQSI